MADITDIMVFFLFKDSKVIPSQTHASRTGVAASGVSHGTSLYRYQKYISLIVTDHIFVCDSHHLNHYATIYTLLSRQSNKSMYIAKKV